MKKYVVGYGCPNDHAFKSIKIIEGTGAQVRPPWYDVVHQTHAFFVRHETYREDSCITCNECHGIWPVFSDTAQMAVQGLVNTRRTAVSLGFDEYIRDNRSSRVPMSAAIEISRRWLQRLEVQWEAAKTTSTTGRFSRYGANIEQKVERSLRTSLAMSEESEQLLKQTVNVTVPPRRRLTVRLHWKQIWQEGDLKVRLLDGTISEIPYRAAVEMAFDQENIQG